MANTTDVRSDLQVFLQKKTASRVKSTLFNIMPTLEFFFALNGDKKAADGLGRPQTDPRIKQTISGVGAPMREKMFAEFQYLPIIDTIAPSTAEAKVMSDYDTVPQVPNWTTTNRPLLSFVQPVFKFCRILMPYKVPHSDVRKVKRSARTEGEAASAVGTVFDVEVKKRTASLCKRVNSMLFGTNGEAGYPASETATSWSSIYSIANALKTDNTYGGVDRTLTANAWWRGNYDTGSHTWTFAQLIDYCNYDLGMVDKGLGVQMIPVGKTLFKKAKAEAKQESYQLLTDGIPDMPEFGFKREIVRIYSGNRPVYIYYEPEMPASHAACLDPSTWTVAIHPDNNFRVTTPSDQTKIDGGDEADTGTINAELMIACEVPAGNAYFTALS